MIEAKEFIPADDMNDRWLLMSCYREADRLNRVGRVYQRALGFLSVPPFSRGTRDALNDGLIAMHDHKGWIVCLWTDAGLMQRASEAINAIWALEGEEVAHHIVVGRDPRLSDIRSALKDAGND